MFNNTRKVVDGISKELKNLFFIIVALIQISYIAYLVFTIIASVGVIVSNVILLCIFLFSFGFFLFACLKKEEDLSNYSTLKYIKARFDTTVFEFKKIYFYLSIFLQLLFISFAITSIVNTKGIFAIHISLIAISVIYLPVLFFTYWKKDKAAKELRKSVKRACTFSRIIVTGTNIAFSVYGIFITSGSVSFADSAILILMILGWVFSVALQLITYYVEIKKHQIIEAFNQDTVGKVVDFVKSNAENVVDFAKNGAELVVRSGEKILSGVNRVKGFFKKHFSKNNEIEDEENFVHK